MMARLLWYRRLKYNMRKSNFKGERRIHFISKHKCNSRSKRVNISAALFMLLQQIGFTKVQGPDCYFLNQILSADVQSI